MHRVAAAAIASVLFVCTTAPCAEGEPAIPQNPERQAQQLRDLLEWNRRSLIQAYEKVGTKDPKWDESARAALEAAARYFAMAAGATTENDVFTAAQKAVDAGCNDPMIRYVHARCSVELARARPFEFTQRMAAACEALGRSDYPPLRRAIALPKAATLRARVAFTVGARNAATRLVDDALALLSENATRHENDVEARQKWFDVATRALNVYNIVLKDHAAAFEKVDSVLAKDPALKLLRLQVKAYFLIAYAWEARGSGLADTVTEEGWKQFGQRLADAEKTLEAAWALKPGDVRTPTLMLGVVKGLNQDRDVMETWFRRAMEADGNNKEACELKLDYLDPKWHGSREAVVAFGRACRDTTNWRAGITLLLADAHYRVVQSLDPDEQSKYVELQDVWNDIRSVNEEYLAHFPHATAPRNMYAGFACLGGRYAEANRQFQVLGDNLLGSAYFTLEAMKQLREIAATSEKPAKP